MDVSTRLEEALLGITDDIEMGDYESYFSTSELDAAEGWDEFDDAGSKGSTTANESGKTPRTYSPDNFQLQTFTPVVETQGMGGKTQRDDWTNDVRKQTNNLYKIQQAEKSLGIGGETASDQRAFAQNQEAVEKLVSETINDRLGPDLLLGLERALSSWMSGATLFFISGIALMQISKEGFPFVFGLVCCVGSVVWIAYCFWQFWMRCGRLHRGERIPYNDNRTQTGFYVILVVFGQMTNLIFGYTLGTGKRVTLLYVNETASQIAQAAEPVSKVASIFIGQAVSLVLLGISVGFVYMWNTKFSSQNTEKRY